MAQVKQRGKYTVIEDEFDMISPYPCAVCREEFRSRRELATHRHEKKEARR